jgi:hypothetical protein
VGHGISVDIGVIVSVGVGIVVGVGVVVPPHGQLLWGWGREVCRLSSWLALVLLSCAVVEAEKKNLQNRKDCQ